MRKPWVTMTEARVLTGRSARTLRRWLAATDNIRTMIDDDGHTRLLNAEDLMRTEADKTGYATRPSFGREPF